MGGLGGGGIPIPVGGGIGGIVVVVIILIVLQFLGGGLGARPDRRAAGRRDLFARAPMTTWGSSSTPSRSTSRRSGSDQFRRRGSDYPETVTVLFTNGTQTGCGVASSATGPFYCPADQKVYLDPGFFDELARRFGAPGDFAQAYVIAHEYGHHVQDVLGTMDQVQQQQTSGNANELSIRLELQADCLAGMWANWVMAHPDQADVESITDEDVTRGAERRRGGRRRPDPGAGHRHDRQGVVDPRLSRAAHAVVQHRVQAGQPGGVRHVRRLRPIPIGVAAGQRFLRAFGSFGGIEAV